MTETTDGCLAKVQDVAKYLNLSRTKVYELMNVGLLPYVRLGFARRVRWDDVRALVERNRVGLSTDDREHPRESSESTHSGQSPVEGHK